jgi:DNA repair protein RadD
MQLRWYQEEAVDSLFTFFEQHGGRNPDGSPARANPLVCLPTGTGKSLVIAEFIRRALNIYPQTRAFMATHVKELITQNASKMQDAWPLAPLGIYSAGLKSRDTIQPIVFGGVKSCVGKGDLFGFRDFLIIDECHLVSPSADTTYVEFIKELLAINPYLKVIGLTATPYRLGLGLMTNGNIFSDIAFDMCNIEGFNRLIAQGFLTPLIPKRTDTELDVSGVGMSNGEFNEGQLQAAVDKTETTFKVLREFVQYGQDRRCWLVFAAGVQHAEHVAEMLNTAFGISTVCLHSKQSDKINDANLAAFKSGEVRCAVSMNKLTTGVDHPPIDYIGMLRPTMSTGLWVQMLGRGTRPYDFHKPDQYIPGFEFTKRNCLVLDFAGNTRRLGPINDPVIPRLKGKGSPGDSPIRICDSCGVYNHASSRVCFACGCEFNFSPKLSKTAGTDELLRSELPQIEPFQVSRMVMSEHISRAGRSGLKCSYYCSGAVPRTFYEYISVEASGFHGKKSRDWVRQRWGEPPEGMTNKDVLALGPYLRTPRQVNVWINKQTPEIVSHEF